MKKAVLALVLSQLSLVQSRSQDVAQPAERRFQIKKSAEVDLGERSIFYNRVQQPELLPRPTPPHLTKVAEFEPQPFQKEYRTIFVAATVYDGIATRVEMRGPSGQHVFWSNINFEYLRGVGAFETPKVNYGFFGYIGQETRSRIDQWNTYVQREGLPPETLMQFPVIPAALLPAGEVFSFVLMEAPTGGPDREIVEELTALHRYFDANKVSLIEAATAAQADREAKAQWLKSHPPQPKDTTINFFPIRSVHGDDVRGTN